MAAPAQTAQKTKVSSTPTTVKAGPMTKVANPTPATKIGTAVTTGGAAGHAGVGAVAGRADYTASNSITTLQTAKPAKVTTTSPTVAKTTNRDKSYL
jgi:hypothetical protein